MGITRFSESGAGTGEGRFRAPFQFASAYLKGRMVEKRKRGRPALDPAGGRSVKVTVSFTEPDYDRMCTRALAADTSIPAIVRQDLRLAWRQRKRDGRDT